MSRFLNAGRWAVLAAVLFLPPIACAADTKAGDLVIHHPWARATPGGATVGGGYLAITNEGPTPDRLLGGSLDASAGFELHSMTSVGGVMTMRPTGPVPLPPGRTVVLDPAALHIMFTGLKHPLKKGEEVAGTLVFERAGTVPVQFTVEGIGAKGPDREAVPAGNAMPGMDMH